MPAAEMLKDFFNALPESAQGGADVSRVYVNRSPDDEHDPVANLKQYIQWEPRTGGCYLFSGLRGAGKTTELNRLVTELRQDGKAPGEQQQAQRKKNPGAGFLVKTGVDRCAHAALCQPSSAPSGLSGRAE